MSVQTFARRYGFISQRASVIATLTSLLEGFACLAAYWPSRSLGLPGGSEQRDLFHFPCSNLPTRPPNTRTAASPSASSSSSSSNCRMATSPRPHLWFPLLLLVSTLHISCSWRPAATLPRHTHHYSRSSSLCMQASYTSRPPSNLLAQIRRHSLVIADTADYKQLEYLPDVREVTTNPSIVWQAAQKEEYFHLLEEACNVRVRHVHLPYLCLSFLFMGICAYMLVIERGMSVKNHKLIDSIHPPFLAPLP